MSEQSELVPVKREAQLPAERADLTPATVVDMMRAIAANPGQMSPENVSVLKELVGLGERLEAREAKRAANRAYAEMQKEMPKVQADKPVHDRSGKLMYCYCDEEEIDAQARPIYQKYGFTVRFSQREEGGKFTAICTLIHVGGHSEDISYTVRSGAGAPGMNETKCDESASTVARREALCNALNIIRRKRVDDPRLLGHNVTQEQAAELEHRVKMLNADVRAFLQFAGASSFAEIKSEVYPVMDRFLRTKEQRGSR